MGSGPWIGSLGPWSTQSYEPKLFKNSWVCKIFGLPRIIHGLCRFGPQDLQVGSQTCKLTYNKNKKLKTPKPSPTQLMINAQHNNAQHTQHCKTKWHNTSTQHNIHFFSSLPLRCSFFSITSSTSYATPWHQSQPLLTRV